MYVHYKLDEFYYLLKFVIPLRNKDFTKKLFREVQKTINSTNYSWPNFFYSSQDELVHWRWKNFFLKSSHILGAYDVGLQKLLRRNVH